MLQYVSYIKKIVVNLHFCLALIVSVEVVDIQ